MKIGGMLCVLAAAACTPVVDTATQVDYLPFGNMADDDDGDAGTGDSDLGGSDLGGGDVEPGDAPGGDSSAPGSSFVDVVTQAAPVAWYRFGRDDLGGTIAHDRTAGAHHGTYAGSATPGMFGALVGDADTAASLFDDAASAIDLPATGVFTAPAFGDFSVSLWVNLHHTPAGGTDSSLFKQGANQDGNDVENFHLVVDSSGRVHLRAESVDLVGPATLGSGRWTLVTLVFASSVAKIYLDDQLAVQSSLSLECDGDLTAHLGGPLPGAAHVDELMLFNRGLTEVEIGGLVAAAREGVAPPSCTLNADARQLIDTAGVYEDLSFTAPLTIAASGVVLRRVSVRVTSGAAALTVSNADDVVLEDVAVTVEAGAGSRGILAQNANRLQLTRVRIAGAIGAIDLENADAIVARGVSVRQEAFDIGGLPPVRVDDTSSDAGLRDLEIIDFASNHAVARSIAVENPSFSLRRALISGNPAANSVGVSIAAPLADLVDSLTDVDILAHNFACVSIDSAKYGQVMRLRCADTLCNGAGASTSMGHALFVGEDSTGFTVASQYDGLCGPPYEGPPAYTAALTQQAFMPRAPMNARFCWE